MPKIWKRTCSRRWRRPSFHRRSEMAMELSMAVHKIDRVIRFLFRDQRSSTQEEWHGLPKPLFSSLGPFHIISRKYKVKAVGYRCRLHDQFVNLTTFYGASSFF